MHVVKFHLFVLLLAILTVVTAFQLPADDFLSRLLALPQKYNLERSVEKSYLHTDRAVYLPGETIWLKGYLFNGNTHIADSVDRVLHIELVDVADRRVRLRAQLRATVGYAPQCPAQVGK